MRALSTRRRPTCTAHVWRTATDDHFWAAADQLVAIREITIYRLKGSRHPRWPDLVYPLDYGYLPGTRAMDGSGIDVWRGSLAQPRVTGAVITIDLRPDHMIREVGGA